MRLFKFFVWILGLIAIGTGIMDFWGGAPAMEGLGAKLGDGFSDPGLNNVFRFFAAIWIGFGVFLIYFTTDLDRYYRPLAIAFVTAAVGGIGRIMSINEFGLPEGRETVIWSIVALEVIFIPALLVWLYIYRRGQEKL